MIQGSGSYNAGTGESYQPPTITEPTIPELRLAEIKAEFEKKAYEQWYVEYPEMKPDWPNAVTDEPVEEGASAGGGTDPVLVNAPDSGEASGEAEGNNNNEE